MTCLVNELLERAQILVTQEKAYLDGARIIPVRKELVVMSRNEELTIYQRQALLAMAESCKMAVNHVPLKERLKGYPESKLYSHESLTSKCRGIVVKLAERFEFAPSPMALGVKHYFATK